MFRIGDTVAFRSEVVKKCGHSKGIADFRATVTQVCRRWVFMTDASGRIKVMPATSMCRVAHNGAILGLV